jgi:hypothetical protein
MRTPAAVFVFLLLPGLTLAQDIPTGDDGPRYLITVHGVTQRATSSTTAQLTFAQYDETASATFEQQFKPGTGFWIAGGYRIWQQAYAGVGFSQSTGKATGSVALSVPHPLLYDTPRTGTRAIDGARQRVQAVNLWAGWRVPLIDRVDVLASLGPSFVTVRRDVAEAITFDEAGAPYSSIVVNNTTLARRSKSVVGVQIGAEVGVKLTSMIAASAGFRYLHANATIDGAAGSSKAKAGGFTAGGGVRLAF